MIYNNIIILDWDDTLFPTTWINKNGIELYHNNIEEFHLLDNLISTLLDRLLVYGKVVIITNATIGWVNMSSRMLPNVSELLKTRIEVISARDITLPTKMWKKISFKKLMVGLMDNRTIHNIISIGDAEYEYNALISLYNWKKCNRKILKTIRLTRSPELDIVMEQLVIMINAIDKIIKTNTHMDLEFKTL